MKNFILSITIFALTNSVVFAQSPCQISLTSVSGTATQTVCANTTITAITYSVSGTNATITSLPSGLTSNFTANVFTISGTPSVAGTFNYTITTTGGCSPNATSAGHIKANPLPKATMSNGSINVCRDSIVHPITFVGSSGTKPYNFTFKVDTSNSGVIKSNNSGRTNGTDNDTAFLNIPTSKTGTFTYYLLSVKDSNNCQQAESDSVKIAVNLNAQANFSVTKVLVDSQNKLQVKLTDYPSAGLNESWKWYFGDGNTITTTTPSDSIIQYTYADTGVYTIRLLCSNVHGCKDSSMHETVSPCFVNFSHVTDTVQKIVTITVDSATAAFAKTYSWNFNWKSLAGWRYYDTNLITGFYSAIDSIVFVDDANSSSLPNPVVNFPLDTIYPVILRITTANGRSCIDNYDVIGKSPNFGWRTAGFKLIVENPYALTNIETPTISASGATLTSSSAIGNQWYLNGNIITGATSQSYTATQNGSYTVVLNGTTTSAPYNVTTITSIAEYNTATDVNVFPNPTTGIINLHFQLENAQLNISDVLEAV